MSKIYPSTNVNVLYLDCLEREDREEGENKRAELHARGNPELVVETGVSAYPVYAIYQ